MHQGMHYTFRESIPFDLSIDPGGRQERVKAKNLKSALKQLSKNNLGCRWILISMDSPELEVYGMTDQPTTCPKCGCRTSFTDIPLTNPLRQNHTCNSVYCRFRFIAEDGD
jgi:hypothetical protein